MPRLFGCPEWMSRLRAFAGREFELPERSVGGKLMVIVEPRCDPLLPLVISNFACQLGPLGWGLMVVHGTQNRQWLERHPSFRPRDRKRVLWMDLGKKNLSISDYNALFLDRDFWRRIRGCGGREVLIFQVDTILLDGERLDREYAGNRYDYVGAPWRRAYLGMSRVGNGGLSLRRVSKMVEYCRHIDRLRKATPLLLGQEEHCGLDLADLAAFKRLRNEDVLFSIMASCEGGRVPGIEVASGFSAESLLIDPKPCGLHKPTCRESEVLQLLRQAR